MKTVLLLAGRGKRLEKLTEDNHKSLIPLLGRPLLGYLIDGFIKNNQRDIMVIVGYKKEKILGYLRKNYSHNIKLTVINNKKYRTTNNLYSLYCARSKLQSEEFILCNGDNVLDQNIIKLLLNDSHGSAIAIDDLNKRKYIDSPKTIIKQKRILDIGRHISLNKSGGYAIGLYKFDKQLSQVFFPEAEKILNQGLTNTGFHEPLGKLYAKHYVAMVSTQGLGWIDVDESRDIVSGEKILKIIQKEETITGK